MLLEKRNRKRYTSYSSIGHILLVWIRTRENWFRRNGYYTMEIGDKLDSSTFQLNGMQLFWEKHIPFLLLPPILKELSTTEQ